MRAGLFDAKSAAPLLSSYSGAAATTNENIDTAHKALIQQGNDQINIVMHYMAGFFNEMVILKDKLDIEIQQYRSVRAQVLLTWLITEKDCRKGVVDVAQDMNACAERAKTYPTIEKLKADVAQLIAQIAQAQSTSPIIAAQLKALAESLKLALDKVVAEEAKVRAEIAKINFRELTGIILKYGHESAPKDKYQTAAIAKANAIIQLSVTIEETITARFKPVVVAYAAAKK